MNIAKLGKNRKSNVRDALRDRYSYNILYLGHEYCETPKNLESYVNDGLRDHKFTQNFGF